jgi:hypothetical protein
VKVVDGATPRRGVGLGSCSCPYLSQYDATQKNDRRRNSPRASNPEWDIEGSGPPNWLSSASLAAARPRMVRLLSEGLSGG